MNTSIDAFLEMMSAERGSSQRTIEAYQRDLEDVEVYLNKRKPKSNLNNASTDSLAAYLAKLTRLGLAASTSARRLSAIKQYYQFLYTDGIRKDNPSTGLDSPRKTKALPKYLSEKEVDKLLKTAHEDSSNDGKRLAALLEILYASGLRVSELITLPLNAFQKNPLHKGKFTTSSLKARAIKNASFPLTSLLLKQYKPILMSAIILAKMKSPLTYLLQGEVKGISLGNG